MPSKVFNHYKILLNSTSKAFPSMLLNFQVQVESNVVKKPLQNEIDELSFALS